MIDVHAPGRFDDASCNGCDGKDIECVLNIGPDSGQGGFEIRLCPRCRQETEARLRAFRKNVVRRGRFTRHVWAGRDNCINCGELRKTAAGARCEGVRA